MTTIQRLQRLLLFRLGQHTVRRFATSLSLLALIVMGLPALSGAQPTCQSDGDVDQNGSVTAADALLAFQQALSLVQLDTCQQTIADVFPQPTAPDSNITASDALCIFQKALSLPSCLDALFVGSARFTSISTGNNHTCGVRDTGGVECWGDDAFGQAAPPAGMFTAVSAGSFHTCGIQDTGGVECWGDDDFGQASPPAGVFTAVSAGSFHTCGIQDTGGVECWGDDDFGQASPPAGMFTAVSAGSFHTCGIQDTGGVECWGDDDFGQTSPPAGMFTAVSAGSFHTCGVQGTGGVECWGDDDFGQASPPAGMFTAVSAGSFHTCGVQGTGGVECWGDDVFGQATPPAGMFTVVSAALNHTCGIRDTGSVECWGGDDSRVPVASGSIPKQSLAVGGVVTLTVSPYFTDPDGDPMTYQAQSGDSSIVTVAVSGDSVSIEAQDAGTTAVTVTAIDPDGLSAVQEFNVQVNVVFVIGAEVNIAGPDGLMAVGRDVTWVAPPPNVDGLDEGWNHRTNSNGDKDGLQVYVGGTDLSVEYWENGVIQSTASYRDGEPFGSFNRYTNGELDGIQYTITGKDWSFESYRTGTFHGPYGRYGNGEPEGTFGSFSNGELDGIQTTITGEGWFFQSYRSGTLHGPYGAYNSDGQKHGAFGMYITGSKAGEVTYDDGNSETGNENNPPLPVSNSIPEEITFDNFADSLFLANWFFWDPDGESYDLTYFVSSQPPGMFDTFPDGSVIGLLALSSSVPPGASGQATLTACDPGGLCAQINFKVVVQPEFTRVDPGNFSVEAPYCEHPLIADHNPLLEVEICARDVTCEDGDEVHLELFIDEDWRSVDFLSLSNSHSCQTLQVQGKIVDIPYRMRTTSEEITWWDWDKEQPLCQVGCSPDCFVGPELFAHPGKEENRGELTIRTLIDSDTREWSWRDDHAWISEGTIRVQAVASEAAECEASSTAVFRLMDACDDGEEISYRLFQDDISGGPWTDQWPQDRPLDYVTPSLNSEGFVQVACPAGKRLCYGAESSDGRWSWGVGLDGTQGCPACCRNCPDSGEADFRIDPFTCDSPAETPSGHPYLVWLDQGDPLDPQIRAEYVVSECLSEIADCVEYNRRLAPTALAACSQWPYPQEDPQFIRCLDALTACPLRVNDCQESDGTLMESACDRLNAAAQVEGEFCHDHGFTIELYGYELPDILNSPKCVTIARFKNNLGYFFNVSEYASTSSMALDAIKEGIKDNYESFGFSCEISNTSISCISEKNESRETFTQVDLMSYCRP